MVGHKQKKILPTLMFLWYLTMVSICFYHKSSVNRSKSSDMKRSQTPSQTVSQSIDGACFRKGTPPWPSSFMYFMCYVFASGRVYSAPLLAGETCKTHPKGAKSIGLPGVFSKTSRGKSFRVWSFFTLIFTGRFIYFCLHKKNIV